MQGFVQGLFEKRLAVLGSLGMQKALTSGIGIGVNQFVIFCSYALAFWAGAQFISQGWLDDFGDVSRCFFALAFAASGAGQANAYLGDQGKAELAKESIFQLLHRAARHRVGEDRPVEAGTDERGIP